jgi:hypothetical protein
MGVEEPVGQREQKGGAGAVHPDNLARRARRA